MMEATYSINKYIDHKTVLICALGLFHMNKRITRLYEDETKRNETNKRTNECRKEEEKNTEITYRLRI